MHSLVFKGVVFFYKKKAIKSLRLKLNEKGEFVLSVPHFCTFKDICSFLENSQKWIENAKKRFEKESLKEDVLIFLTKKYQIIFDNTVKKAFFKKDAVISPSKEHLEAFLKSNARIIFSFYLKKWSAKTGLEFTHLSIKKMQTRWGSCNPKKRYINLNLKLLEKSLKAIEYVILHELSHIKFPNHSKEFYAFIFHFMDDFKQRQKEF